MLKVYNTYSKKLEEFKPLQPGKVRMYNCGPTVYSHPHIGNFRSFIFADVLLRHLEYSGYEVTQIMNITDVGHLTLDDIESGEDKLEAAARSEKKSTWEIAEFYMNEFFELAEKLNLRKAYKYPRATEHIKEQIELAQKLLDKGYAYNVNGNIYFDVSKFVSYGKLSGNTLDGLMAGARIEPHPDKRSPMDFAIWKQDPKHLMQWDSPWGKGFPGWHLECSAMSMKYLGETLDIHTGGEDNIFPHHESEIAQSESANGKPFSRYWLHCRHLLVDNRKMSKSAGNFYTVKDIFEKGYDAPTLRYILLSTHYRHPLNFTFEGLESAKQSVQRIMDFKRRLDTTVTSNTGDGIDKLNSFEESFTKAMDDDLNISEALSAVFGFISFANSELDKGTGKAFISKALGLLSKFDSVLDILDMTADDKLDEESEKLISEREKARRSRDFQTSDAVRKKLEAKGIIIEDTPQGPKWKRKR